MALWLLLALSASAGDLVVAVNYFDAHSIRPELEPLGRGAADGRIRAYNDALAASLGVSRADALQLDVSGR